MSENTYMQERRALLTEIEAERRRAAIHRSEAQELERKARAADTRAEAAATALAKLDHEHAARVAA